MRFLATELPEVILVEPTVHRDERGFFLETYHLEKYRRGGIPAPFVQDNHSRSVQNTLRGLHAQRRNPQGKLVRAVEGEIWDVAVDIRPGSPSYRQWVAATLSAEDFRQLWVPPGFAHGFCVLSPVAQVEYKCTALYDRDDEIAIAWDDPDLDVAWPLVGEPRLSAKDRSAPRLRDVEALLRETAGAGRG
ncbi:MAG TPA: dTDP-4-dehydrorhamnose 3,5-epimerase [Thermoanaerobaculia bacterium]|nr:dTDP-4-dehydrorhamnose 3,5-epimerase [Thermoanaerobaculia bacterium]